MKTSFFRLIAVVAILASAAGAVTLHAQDLGAVRERIAARLSKLDELKSKGAVGENNRGLVEVRGADPDAAAVVSAENTDRQAVYAAIGKQSGTSAEQVGRARAKQIAANSAAGVWVQKDDGAWAKK
jgi:uncharacterized protein